MIAHRGARQPTRPRENTCRLERPIEAENEMPHEMPHEIRFGLEGLRFRSPGTSPARRSPGRFSARTPGHAEPAGCGSQSPATIDWNDLLPRQVVGVGGGFVAAVGIAAMALTGSPEGLPITLAGLAAAAAGFAVDLAPRLREAIENLLEDPRAETSRRQVDGGETPRRGVVSHEPPRRLWHPAAAAALSVVPGLGHAYKGTPAIGLSWLAVVAAGYSAFVLPGVVLHGCCVLDALSGNPWTTGRTTVVRP
jgi:hypothetical protein